MLIERESGFYAVGLSTGELVIMEYINGNGWQRSLSRPDVYIKSVLAPVEILI